MPARCDRRQMHGHDTAEPAEVREVPFGPGRHAHLCCACFAAEMEVRRKARDRDDGPRLPFVRWSELPVADGGDGG